MEQGKYRIEYVAHEDEASYRLSHLKIENMEVLIWNFLMAYLMGGGGALSDMWEAGHDLMGVGHGRYNLMGGGLGIISWVGGEA
jgi:hypothetical protein